MNSRVRRSIFRIGATLTVPIAVALALIGLALEGAAWVIVGACDILIFLSGYEPEDSNGQWYLKFMPDYEGVGGNPGPWLAIGLCLPALALDRLLELFDNAESNHE